MGNKDHGQAITGGDVKEERIDGRGHVLPEEGEPQNHLQDGTAQQFRRGKDCKALSREYVTTQHKPVVFVVRMKKWKEKRTMGPKNIKWCKCNDDMMVEYMERVRRRYKELDAEKGTVEGEWRQYNDAFVVVAEELCGRTSGKGGTPRSRNQGWWREEVAKAVGEKREAWKAIYKASETEWSNQPPA